MSEISSSQKTSSSTPVREYGAYGKKASEKPPGKQIERETSCECHDCSYISREAEGASSERKLPNPVNGKTPPQSSEKQRQRESAFRDAWCGAMEFTNKEDTSCRKAGELAVSVRQMAGECCTNAKSLICELVMLH